MVSLTELETSNPHSKRLMSLIVQLPMEANCTWVPIASGTGADQFQVGVTTEQREWESWYSRESVKIVEDLWKSIVVPDAEIVAVANDPRMVPTPVRSLMSPPAICIIDLVFLQTPELKEEIAERLDDATKELHVLYQLFLQIDTSELGRDSQLDPETKEAEGGCSPVPIPAVDAHVR